MFEILTAYILAFFTIGWGGGIIAAMFFPVVLGLRHTPLGKPMNFIANGLGTFLSTLAVVWVCRWLLVPPVYAVFALPLIAMLLNDIERIRRARQALTFAGVDFTEHPEARASVVAVERANLWADIAGFVAAIVIVSPMDMM